MKQRLISAGVGLLILAVVLFFFDTLFFNLVISLVSLLAVYELFHAQKYTQEKFPALLCYSFTALFPFSNFWIVETWFPLFSYLLLFLLFLCLLKKHHSLSFPHLFCMISITLLVSLAFGTAVFLRDAGEKTGFFYILLILCGAWMADTGAYFSGRAFGKRKLAPNISPNKTMEGVIGGVFTVIISYFLVAVAYIQVLHNYGVSCSVDYGRLFLLAVTASLTGVVGDLVASIVKRQCGIKDFGYIMPGHGGIMDRFDSLILVAPFVYLFVHYFPILSF